MRLFSSVRCRGTALSLLAVAGGFGQSPVSVHAQDCKITVHASPQIVYAGQSASVNVLAEFPAAVYAFASAQFNVHSTHPAWSFVSGGVVVGDDVLNIAASQAHMPQQGVFAHPANPYRVWHGVLTPTSNAPALIEVTADPLGFSMYPNRLTSSSVACDADGGSDLVFVNPIRVGQWVAAPGSGVEVRSHDDVWVDGRIITGENPSPAILMGLLLPAIQSAREAATRVGFDGVPDTFAARVQVRSGSDRPMESLAINFTKIEYNVARPALGLRAEVPSGRAAKFAAFRGGVRVAEGEIDPSGGDAPRVPSIAVAEVPAQIGASVEGGLVYSGESGGMLMSWNLRYDRPIIAQARGRDGRAVPISIDRIEVIAPVVDDQNRTRSKQDYEQVGLGAITFEATGVRSMCLTPSQPR